MFNTLASYLLGTSNPQPTGGVEERNVRLTSMISEDDWVLVDRDSEGNSEVDSSSTESLDGYDNLDNQNQLPHLLSRSSSMSSLPCTTMEESWFVTPPPCFTSAGPVHMETSPLENLLIEHPSMSVYQHSNSGLVVKRHGYVTPAEYNISDFSSDEEEQKECNNSDKNKSNKKQCSNKKEVDVHRPIPPTPRRNRVDILAQQEKQRHKNTQAQKVPTLFFN